MTARTFESRDKLSKQLEALVTQGTPEECCTPLNCVKKISIIFSRTDLPSKTGRFRKENNNLTEIIFWGTF
jgi:hypothetical protein